MVLAALASAASASPVLRTTLPGDFDSESQTARRVALLSPAFGPSSHLTASASLPWNAGQVLPATTATPLPIGTTPMTPGIALALAASNDATLPPKTGQRATAA